jgi:hypothetical protein
MTFSHLPSTLTNSGRQTTETTKHTKWRLRGLPPTELDTTPKKAQAASEIDLGVTCRTDLQPPQARRSRITPGSSNRRSNDKRQYIAYVVYFNSGHAIIILDNPNTSTESWEKG